MEILTASYHSELGALRRWSCKVPEIMYTNVLIVRGGEQFPGPHHVPFPLLINGKCLQTGRMGDLRWNSCQDRKGQPPQSRHATAEVVAKWGRMEGHQCLAGIKMFPRHALLVCRIHRLHACLLSLLPLLCQYSPQPTFPSVFLSFYHLMQFPLPHGRADHTSEETTASCRFTHTSGQTVLCRRDISVLAMPTPKCFSRFLHPL